MLELTNELLIEILVFILVFTFTSVALKRLFKDKISVGVISLAIAILSTVYLSYSQMDFISSTYGLTGKAILFSIPFIIALFFIYSSDIGGILRKIFWILYGITNILLLGEANISDETDTFLVTIIILVIGSIVLFDTPIKNFLTVRKNLRH